MRDDLIAHYQVLLQQDLLTDVNATPLMRLEKLLIAVKEAQEQQQSVSWLFEKLNTHNVLLAMVKKANTPVVFMHFLDSWLAQKQLFEGSHAFAALYVFVDTLAESANLDALLWKKLPHLNAQLANKVTWQQTQQYKDCMEAIKAQLNSKDDMKAFHIYSGWLKTMAPYFHEVPSDIISVLQEKLKDEKTYRIAAEVLLHFPLSIEQQQTMLTLLLLKEDLNNTLARADWRQKQQQHQYSTWLYPYVGQLVCQYPQNLPELFNFLLKKLNDRVEYSIVYEVLMRFDLSTEQQLALFDMSLRACKDKENLYRDLACYCIGQFVSRYPDYLTQALLALEAQLTNKDIQVRLAAGEALLHFPLTVTLQQAVASMLRTASRQTPKDALEMKWDAKIGFVTQGGPRKKACQYLRRLAQQYPYHLPEVLAALQARLSDKNIKVRLAAGEALLYFPLSSELQQAVAAMLCSLNKAPTEWKCYQTGCLYLERMAHQYPHYLPQVLLALQAGLNDTIPEVRLAAGETLLHFALTTDLQQAVAEMLLSVHNHPEWNYRNKACRYLGQLARQYPHYLPHVSATLATALQDELMQVRLAACQVLINLPSAAQPPQWLSIILQTAGSTDINYRCQICTWLGQAAWETNQLCKVVTTLVDRVSDVDANVRLVAYQALLQLQAKSPYALPIYLQLNRELRTLRSKERGLLPYQVRTTIALMSLIQVSRGVSLKTAGYVERALISLPSVAKNTIRHLLKA
jgi:stress response protein SCP2